MSGGRVADRTARSMTSLAVALAAALAGCSPDAGSPDDPLSAPEFLRAGLTAGDVAWVSATLIDESARPDGVARLCDLVMESYPPQCGGPDLFVDNPEDVEAQSAAGVRWTDWGLFELEVVSADHVRVVSFGRMRA